MARRLRPRLEGIPVHVTHRGVNRQDCFRSDADRRLYLGLLQEFADERHCAIHAYVLMTNHVHLLITPWEPDACSRLMKDIAQRYTQHANRTWKRTGPLWDGRFKSCLVDSGMYFLACQRYIELNAVRAGMVNGPLDYPWSSFMTNAFGIPSRILTPHPSFASLGRDVVEARRAYRQLFDHGQCEEEVRRIREAVHAGLALGGREFVDQVARLTKTRKHGRPSKSCTNAVQKRV